MLKRVIMMAAVAVLLAVSIQPASAVDYWPTRGWRTADPASQGMDAKPLKDADQEIRANLPHINGLVVIRHGYLVWESYYGDYGRNTRHNVMSVTKSITSALVGIALDKHILWDINESIPDFFPEYYPPDVDGRKRNITIKDLLELRSGLAWYEPVPFSPEQANSLHNAGSILGLPMAANPGDSWVYSTGDAHLLSAILTRVTGKSTLTFADQNLFRPLGITNRRWSTDADGVNLGGVDLYLTPRDMAKIGYLYLNNGVWDNRQIVSPQWVSTSTSPQPGKGPTPGQPGYGYLWWIDLLRGHYTYYADGYGGQFIFVIPDLDMVVAMTGYEKVTPDVSAANNYASLQIVASYIVPAAQ
jgi:CubicO group peptidase (beta-lactamase class C family)